MIMHSQLAVSDAEALMYDCPLCHQSAGLHCVYAPLAMADPNSRSVAQQQRLSQVGKPTRKVHNERRNVIHEIRNREFQQRLLEQRHKQRHLTARKALALWDEKEDALLRAWLNQHGSVLWS
jgi:hypothetical protein